MLGTGELSDFLESVEFLYLPGTEILSDLFEVEFVYLLGNGALYVVEMLCAVQEMKLVVVMRWYVERVEFWQYEGSSY